MSIVLGHRGEGHGGLLFPPIFGWKQIGPKSFLQNHLQTLFHLQSIRVFNKEGACSSLPLQEIKISQIIIPLIFFLKLGYTQQLKHSLSHEIEIFF